MWVNNRIERGFSEGYEGDVGGIRVLEFGTWLFLSIFEVNFRFFSDDFIV